jgi:LysM domain
MTVAPELPPVPAGRRREVDLSAVPPPRSGRRGSIRHPAGSVARSVARPMPPPARPTPAVRPGLRWVAGADDVAVGPGVTGWPTEPGAAPPSPLARPVRPPLPARDELAGARSARDELASARPARLAGAPLARGAYTGDVPARVRPAGPRVVRPARRSLRLTRRGRVVVGLLVLLAVSAAVLLAVGRVRSIGLDPVPVPASAPAEAVVGPGETLWSVAERVAPGDDPRAVVDRLRALNDLPSGIVHPGQRLRLRAS